MTSDPVRMLADVLVEADNTERMWNRRLQPPSQRSRRISMRCAQHEARAVTIICDAITRALDLESLTLNGERND